MTWNGMVNIPTIDHWWGSQPPATGPRPVAAASQLLQERSWPGVLTGRWRPDATAWATRDRGARVDCTGKLT